MTTLQFIGVLIISAGILIAAILKQAAQRRAEQEEQETRLFDSAKLQNEIFALYRDSQELERLDSMIVDIRLCKPDELHKAFRIQWEGSTGTKSIDFMTTGDNSNTAHMIQLAEDQRAQLNADIQARIFDLYARAQEMTIYAGCREHNGEHSDSSGQARGSAI